VAGRQCGARAGLSAPGPQIPGWTLLETLGRGGNATVWAAVRDAEQEPVALKVLEAVRPQREPYQRFIAEIGFLRSLQTTDGVLPLLDAHLPESPGTEDRAWLAMPIAEPIAIALDGLSLDIVVEAIARIASTLARLKAEHGVAHRDIKPGNLYRAGDDWLIGDFGLIAAPDLESLTRSGQRLGPAHFTPYEVIREPARADPFPADVYSLAKTLWVLATGQVFPPEGHQSFRTRGYTIADMCPHTHAAALDRMIDAATLIHPNERPTVEAVAADLAAWRDLSSSRGAVDLGDARIRLRERLDAQLAGEDLRERQKDMGALAVRRFQELIAPLNDALKNLHPRAEVDRMDDDFTRNTLRLPRHAGMADVVFEWQRCSRVSAGPRAGRYMLRVGRGLDVTSDGTLRVYAFVDVGDPETTRQDFYWAAPPSGGVPVGSIAAESVLEELVAEIETQARDAVEVFVANAPTG